MPLFLPLYNMYIMAGLNHDNIQKKKTFVYHRDYENQVNEKVHELFDRIKWAQ